MRSLERWEALKRELEPVEEKIAKYESNKIALRKDTLKELYTQRRELIKRLNNSCPHDRVYIFHGSSCDIGYGCDRYYYHDDMYCQRCKTKLTNKTDDHPLFDEGTPVGRVKGPYELSDAVFEYSKSESLSDDELRFFGFQRQTRTTTNFVRI